MRNEEKYLVDFFHENTVNYNDQTLFERGERFKKGNNISTSRHSNDKRIEIPKNFDKNLIPNLKSERVMKYPIDIADLILLLYNSYNIKMVNGMLQGIKGPSAGGIYPLELYIVSKNVKGLKRGVYFYEAKNTELKFINQYSDLGSLNLPINSFTKNASCMVYFVCNIVNICNKYGARGYRYCLIECGHVAQNISIVASKLNIKYCPVGGFNDYKISKILNLNKDFYPLYSYALGG